MSDFNPSSVGVSNGNIFGLPQPYELSKVIAITVPWEVTASYGSGTSEAPQKMIEESIQIDLYDPDLENSWAYGIFSLNNLDKWKAKNDELRKKVVAYQEDLAEGKEEDAHEQTIEEVNQQTELLKEEIKTLAKEILKNNKLPSLLGGDHSTPLGLIEALNEEGKPFSILQVDAHADLRIAYEGFEYSHASIMHNALQNDNVEKLVQVGIRDICEEEIDYINNSEGRIKTFFDNDLKAAQFGGTTWHDQCQKILNSLTDEVYVSFDIDALDPQYCPGTGTPVPGGLSYNQAVYLITELAKSGRKIIGFDLNEVGNSTYDAIVGARLFFKLCNMMYLSNK